MSFSQLKKPNMFANAKKTVVYLHCESLLAVNNSYSLYSTKGNSTLRQTKTQDNLENMCKVFEAKSTSDFICMPIHSLSGISTGSNK